MPTPNTALFDADGGERFFMGTVGKPWTHGMFGCTRTQGWQMHEGIDIRATARDNRGEPVDPIFATADGTVAYINTNPGLSAYGIYIVLEHQVSSMAVWSLYAHLAEVEPDLRVGQTVQAGETIARMGRTANTRQRISKDRAHLHFEIGFLTNPKFPAWLQSTVKGARNDHGAFNGQNFIGIDPRIILLSSHRFPANFDLARFLTVQTALCRIAVRTPEFDWVRRYPMLVQPKPSLPAEGIVGYEIHFDYTGVPIRLYPLTETDLPGNQRFTLLEVNPTEYQENPCRRIVTKQNGKFQLGTNGIRLLELLTHQ